MDIPQVSPDAEKSQPTILDQMGGLSGLVSSTLPILVFVPANNAWGLLAAIGVALAVALAIFLWRLARKENLQPAISGFLSVAICAAIAWVVGSAKGFFLYGIWVSLLFGIVFLLSLVLRWPAVGVIWRGINGEDMGWRTVAGARRAYAWATLGWAVVFFARFFVQNGLYNADNTQTLWIARMLMGWPLTGLVTLFTVFMVRKARAALDEEDAENAEQGAENAEQSATPVDATAKPEE